MTVILCALASVVINAIATYVVVQQLNQANDRFLFESYGDEQKAQQLSLKIQVLVYLIASGLTLLSIALQPTPETLSDGLVSVIACLGLLLLILGLLHFAVLTIVASIRSQNQPQAFAEQFEAREAHEEHLS